jgi:hypothetical protein
VEKAERPHDEIEVVAQERGGGIADGVDGEKMAVADEVPGLGVVGEVLEEIEAPVEVPAVEDQGQELGGDEDEGDRPEGIRGREAATHREGHRGRRARPVSLSVLLFVSLSLSLGRAMQEATDFAVAPGDEKGVDGIIGRADGLPAGEAQDFAGTTTAESGAAHGWIESGPAPDAKTVAGPGP